MNGGEGQRGRVAAAVMAEMEAMTWEQRMDAFRVALDAWDRGCRELHEQHMADLAELRTNLIEGEVA